MGISSSNTFEGVVFEIPIGVLTYSLRASLDSGEHPTTGVLAKLVSDRKVVVLEESGLSSLLLELKEFLSKVVEDTFGQSLSLLFSSLDYSVSSESLTSLIVSPSKGKWSLLSTLLDKLQEWLSLLSCILLLSNFGQSRSILLNLKLGDEPDLSLSLADLFDLRSLNLLRFFVDYLYINLTLWRKPCDVPCL